MSFIKNILIGAIIGLANIIPGVSGGTMAVVLNVYDRLIGAISNIKKSFRKNGMFLAALVIGAALAILLFSRVIAYFLDNFYMITNFFFIGIIVGSIPMVYKRATEERFKPMHMLACAATLAIMLFTVYFIPVSGETGAIITTISLASFVKLFFVSIISAICMIIPGISGSFVMLLFGTYETVTTAISDFNIIILIPVGAGSLFGILLGSKVIEFVLKKFPQATYFAILGFMLGSMPAIVDKIQAENAFVGGWQVVIAILVLILGMAVSYLFSDEKFKAFLVGER